MSYRDATELSFVASKKEGVKLKIYHQHGIKKSMVNVYCVCFYVLV